MTLNKANLFQLTLNSQLNITVSAHVCVLMYLSCIMCVRATAYICIRMTCVRMYVL